MPILDPKCFTLIHLQQTKVQTGASDLLMLERCTLALELVGRLKQHGLEFIFKGGTSLLLHLPRPLRLPSLSSMLGDKLAAFAPATIGYPYEPITRRGDPDVPRPANVVKHLHDLGQLAAMANNLNESFATYRRIHAEQCRWRGDHTIEVCLTDSQAAAVLASKVEALQQRADNPQVDFFRRGIASVNSHMFAEPFGREAVRIASGRAALVAEVIRREQTQFPLAQVLADAPNISTLKKAKLEGDWATLERLKRTDIQAYALWEHAQRVRKTF